MSGRPPFTTRPTAVRLAQPRSSQIQNLLTCRWGISPKVLELGVLFPKDGGGEFLTHGKEARMNDNPKQAERAPAFSKLVQMLIKQNVQIEIGADYTHTYKGKPVACIAGRYLGTRFVSEVAFRTTGLTDVQIEHRKLEALRTIKVQLDKVRRMNDQQCGGR